MQSLDTLYYPFSRCVSTTSLKHLLLIYESISFLDPIDDESWRARVFERMEPKDQFARYREVADALPDLLAEKVVARIEPSKLLALKSNLATASALSDLLDPSWQAVARHPSRFGLPAQLDAANSRPTWQVFSRKLPIGFAEALRSEHSLSHHLITDRGPRTAWDLTYEAGSAAAMAVHLAACDELNLTPVTDSELHHRLLLLKLTRSEDREKDSAIASAEEAAALLARRISMNLAAEFLPPEAVDRLSFSDVMRFREESKDLRKQFFLEVCQRVGAEGPAPTVSSLEKAAARVTVALKNEEKEYHAELTSIRDRLWPTLAASINKAMPSGGMAAVAASVIGGPGHALAASVIAAGLSLLKGTLDLRAEKNRIANGAASGVAYLSTLRRVRPT